MVSFHLSYIRILSLRICYPFVQLIKCKTSVFLLLVKDAHYRIVILNTRLFISKQITFLTSKFQYDMCLTEGFMMNAIQITN